MAAAKERELLEILAREKPDPLPAKFNHNSGIANDKKGSETNRRNGDKRVSMLVNDQPANSKPQSQMVIVKAIEEHENDELNLNVPEPTAAEVKSQQGFVATGSPVDNIIKMELCNGSVLERVSELGNTEKAPVATQGPQLRTVVDDREKAPSEIAPDIRPGQMIQQILNGPVRDTIDADDHVGKVYLETKNLQIQSTSKTDIEKSEGIVKNGVDGLCKHDNQSGQQCYSSPSHFSKSGDIPPIQLDAINKQLDGMLSERIGRPDITEKEANGDQNEENIAGLATQFSKDDQMLLKPKCTTEKQDHPHVGTADPKTHSAVKLDGGDGIHLHASTEPPMVDPESPIDHIDIQNIASQVRQQSRPLSRQSAAGRKSQPSSRQSAAAQISPQNLNYNQNATEVKPATARCSPHAERSQSAPITGADSKKLDSLKISSKKASKISVASELCAMKRRRQVILPGNVNSIKSITSEITRVRSETGTQNILLYEGMTESGTTRLLSEIAGQADYKRDIISVDFNLTSNDMNR